jgi:exo-beta-1,3-glucanase (GH17 family)
MFRKLSALILFTLVFTAPSLFGASASWGAEKPWIVIDSVPKIGEGNLVRGHIELGGNNNSAYTVTMALEITRGDRSIWAPKPTATQPTVGIDSDGSFSCNFVSGGSDNIAERLYVYLIPESFIPNADTALTENAALDVVIIDRYEERLDIRQKYPDALKHPARTKRLSLNYSPYTGDLSPEKNSPIPDAHVRRQLALIHPYADTVKIFGVTGELNKIYEIAKREFNFRIIGGCWIDGYSSESDIMNELDTLIDLANGGLIDIALVGSETVYRNDLPVSDLIKHIQYVRGKINADIPVGTADIPAAFLDNPALIGACDVVCVNIYPFHSNIEADAAAGNLSAVYDSVANAAAGKDVIVAETGWPSSGAPNGVAIPSDRNSGKYFGDAYSFSRENDVEIVWFSSYSEPWKAAGGNDYEAHFGLFTSDEKLKEQFEPILRTISDTPYGNGGSGSGDGDESWDESGCGGGGGGCAAAGIGGLAGLFFCAFAVRRLIKGRRGI